jgi:hypothetical protein
MSMSPIDKLSKASAKKYFYFNKLFIRERIFKLLLESFA